MLVGVQGWFIWDQTVTTQKQLEATQAQLEVTQEAQKLTAQTEALSVLQRLSEETGRISELIYQPTGAFEAARRTDCVPPPTATLADEQKLRSIAAHYETYFEAAKLKLISANQWAEMCKGAEEFIAQSCFLTAWWQERGDKIGTEEFRTAFIPTCQIQVPEGE